MSFPNAQLPGSGPLSKIKNELIKPINISKENTTIPPNSLRSLVEEFLYVKEIVPNEIYDMRISETKFRELLKKQKLVKNPVVQTVDQYSFFQFTISYIHEDNNKLTKEIFVDTIIEPPTYDSTKHRYKIIKNRVYYSPMELDVDVHRDYHLIVRLFRITIGDYLFEIIVPQQQYAFPNSNIYASLIGENVINFPSGTNFVIKKI